MEKKNLLKFIEKTEIEGKWGNKWEMYLRAKIPLVLDE